MNRQGGPVCVRPRTGGQSSADSYLLILRNLGHRRVRVGRLGRLCFESGYYLYVGSGGNYPLRRVQRHLRPDKPVHWHVDYLTTGRDRMKPTDVYLLPGTGECELAAQLSRQLAVVSGFGASDCRCAGHLCHAPDIAGLAAALDRLSG